jgi:hypothetical protein
MKFLRLLVLLLSFCSASIAANRKCDEKFESIAGIQTKISGKKTYYLTAKLSGSEPSLTVFEGENSKGLRVATVGGVEVYSGENGKRLEFGGWPSAVEILIKPGSKHGAGVLYYRNNGKLGKKYFDCTITEKDGQIVGIRAKEVKLADVRDENKLVSPIEPTLPGTTLANTHGVGAAVDGKFSLIRSMAPKTKEEFDSLQKHGVNEVIIFKDGPRKVIDDEIAIWKKRGIPEERLHHIPFAWKDFSDFKTPGEQTLEALKILLEARAQGRTVLFHCTVGEDRTGYLAALYRLMTEGGDPYVLFKKEMCERGYENGDPLKPYGPVVLEIREALTRTYLKMAYLIKTGQLSESNLNPSVLDRAPSDAELALAGLSYDSKRCHCHTSAGFRLPNGARD